jgi:hypothetical protein
VGARALSVTDYFAYSPTRGTMYVVQPAALGLRGVAVGARTCLAADYIPGCVTGALQAWCAPDALALPGGCVRVNAPFDVAVVRRGTDAPVLVDPDVTRPTVAYAVATSRAGVLAVAYQQMTGSDAAGFWAQLKVAYFLSEATGLQRTGEQALGAPVNVRAQAWSEGGYYAGNQFALRARPGSNGFTLAYVEPAALDTEDALTAVDEAQLLQHKACDTAPRSRVRVVHLGVELF